MAGERPFEIDGANRIPLIGGDGWSQVRQRPGVAELECVGRVKYVYTLSVTIFLQKRKKERETCYKQKPLAGGFFFLLYQPELENMGLHLFARNR
jgi:hypothetical protein